MVRCLGQLAQRSECGFARRVIGDGCSEGERRKSGKSSDARPEEGATDSEKRRASAAAGGIHGVQKIPRQSFVKPLANSTDGLPALPRAQSPISCGHAISIPKFFWPPKNARS